MPDQSPAKPAWILVGLVALALLAAAKGATVYVPLLFKRMVDLFADPANLPVTLPLGLVIGYGALRIASIVAR